MSRCRAVKIEMDSILAIQHGVPGQCDLFHPEALNVLKLPVDLYIEFDLGSYGDEASEETNGKVLAVVGPGTACSSRLDFELCH